MHSTTLLGGREGLPRRKTARNDHRGEGRRAPGLSLRGMLFMTWQSDVFCRREECFL